MDANQYIASGIQYAKQAIQVRATKGAVCAAVLRALTLVHSLIRRSSCKTRFITTR